MFSYIIRFVLSINPRATVSWLPLNVSRSSDIKNRNRIGESRDLCGMPVGVSQVVI